MPSLLELFALSLSFPFPAPPCSRLSILGYTRNEPLYLHLQRVSSSQDIISDEEEATQERQAKGTAYEEAKSAVNSTKRCVFGLFEDAVVSVPFISFHVVSDVSLALLLYASSGFLVLFFPFSGQMPRSFWFCCFLVATSSWKSSCNRRKTRASRASWYAFLCYLYCLRAVKCFLVVNPGKLLS